MMAVFGYAGDAHQIRDQMKVHESLNIPIVIMSPTDAPIKRMGPHICRHAGKRAYVGQDSLDRQSQQMRILLEYPFDYYLLNDSDSVCLSAQLPRYLFNSSNVLWSNVVSDEMHKRMPGYPWPRLAFQPPYFMSRSVLERFLSVADTVKAEPQTPFIDWWMMAVAVRAGIIYRNFSEGASLPSSDAHTRNVMATLVSHGKYFLHSIKKPDVLAEMLDQRRRFVKNHR